MGPSTRPGWYLPSTASEGTSNDVSFAQRVPERARRFADWKMIDDTQGEAVTINQQAKKQPSTSENTVQTLSQLLNFLPGRL